MLNREVATNYYFMAAAQIKQIKQHKLTGNVTIQMIFLKLSIASYRTIIGLAVPLHTNSC